MKQVAANTREDGGLGAFSSLMGGKRKRSVMQARQHMLLLMQPQIMDSGRRQDTHNSLSAACSGLVSLLG